MVSGKKCLGSDATVRQHYKSELPVTTRHCRDMTDNVESDVKPEQTNKQTITFAYLCYFKYCHFSGEGGVWWPSDTVKDLERSSVQNLPLLGCVLEQDPCTPHRIGTGSVLA